MESKMLRDIYDTMLDSGDLDALMPEATGIWENDRVKFAHIQEELDKILDPDISDFEKMIDDNWEEGEEIAW